MARPATGSAHLASGALFGIGQGRHGDEGGDSERYAHPGTLRRDAVQESKACVHCDIGGQDEEGDPDQEMSAPVDVLGYFRIRLGASCKEPLGRRLNFCRDAQDGLQASGDVAIGGRPG